MLLSTLRLPSPDLPKAGRTRIKKKDGSKYGKEDTKIRRHRHSLVMGIYAGFLFRVVLPRHPGFGHLRDLFVPLVLVQNRDIKTTPQCVRTTRSGVRGGERTGGRGERTKGEELK